MYFISSQSTGVPQIQLTNGTQIGILLNEILVKGLPSLPFNSFHNGIFIFNNGLNYNENTIFNISDDIKTIQTKLVRINANSYAAVEDISSLMHGQIKINYPVIDGLFEETPDGNVLKLAHGTSIHFKNTGRFATVEREGVQDNAIDFYAYNISSWQLIYNDTSIVLMYVTGAYRLIFFLCSNKYITSYTNPNNTDSFISTNVLRAISQKTGVKMAPDISGRQYSGGKEGATLLINHSFSGYRSEISFFSFGVPNVDGYFSISQRENNYVVLLKTSNGNIFPLLIEKE